MLVQYEMPSPNNIKIFQHIYNNNNNLQIYMDVLTTSHVIVE